MLKCIVGPTAAGKSSLAMALARARGLAIVSADSRQVYRGFDVGTAKPTREEQALVPHYGIDVLPPTERYSAHRWASDAEQWMAEARSRGVPPVVVGGTGLYLRALVQPFDAVPTLDAERRAALEPWLAARSTAELSRWCTVLDPSRAHLGRTQLLRAVETALLTGRRISEAFGGEAHAPPRHNVRYLVVDPGPVLASRIAERVHDMLRAGLLDEIRTLAASIPHEAPAWNASGYGVMRDAAFDRRPIEEATERMIIETRQYAKRQRTWFRHQLPAEHVTMVNPNDPHALDQVLAWWDAPDPSRTGGHGAAV